MSKGDTHLIPDKAELWVKESDQRRTWTKDCDTNSISSMSFAADTFGMTRERILRSASMIDRGYFVVEVAERGARGGQVGRRGRREVLFHDSVGHDG